MNEATPHADRIPTDIASLLIRFHLWNMELRLQPCFRLSSAACCQAKRCRPAQTIGRELARKSEPSERKMEIFEIEMTADLRSR
jgi:hypothetical protein